MSSVRLEKNGENIEIKGGLWYLAGPFFNPLQKAWAEKVRDLVIDADRHYYAPVENMFQDRIHDKEKADKVFQDNVENLLHASVVLCQFDWLLAPKQELCVMDTYHNIAITGPLNIPDAGTIWEMGYACALRRIRNIPFRIHVRGPAVVGYFSQKTDKLNLMLARSCDAFYNGEEEVKRFIKEGSIRPEDTFKGKEI